MTIETQSQWLTDLRVTLTDDHATQTARLTELTADTGDPGDAHTRAALIAATRQNVERIADALRAMAEGRYGACEACGTQIPPERLQVVPHARRCVPCQR
ncbi:TraR/DksA family transcriptional regulator [Micromonospora okii]|uniref:TraR/DksA family transcriptional regulator n=1 Tax=Micromonospora okii TaxID=1182970 RepID=UPI001E62C5D5|nr:TraR/DksA C4-type zinc finger protein [Micromonospora okii]